MSVSTTTALPPVTVISGFLGAGKTTLLRHLLMQAEGRRWAAVVNDIAALNIDAQIVAASAEGAARTVALGNGCVCCSIRDELAETLAELGATGNYEHVIVETTGAAEVRPIADLFTRKNAFGRSVSDFARLNALITVIDARMFLDEQAKAAGGGIVRGQPKEPWLDLMLEQAECADLLVINKCDLVSAAELEAVELALRGLNPRAEVIQAEHGQVPAEVVIDRARFDPAETIRAARWMKMMPSAVPGHAAPRRDPVRTGSRHGLDTVVFEARAPFARERLVAWIESGALKNVLRAKGFFWVQEQAADIGFLSVAGGRTRWEFVGTWAAALRERGIIGEAEVPAAARARWQEPHGDRRQELVFIGAALDESRIRSELAQCLSTGDAR